MLCHYYAEHYPETFDPNLPKALTYCGPYRLEDQLPESHMRVGEAILSPTRSYAPVIYKAMSILGDEIKGLIHCSGGAQTKCLKFGRNVHFVKDNLFPTPPLFSAIQQASGTDWQEMYKVFNMGHRMEVYVLPERVNEMIDIAHSFNIEARQIGFTESAEVNQLTLTDHAGTRHEYR
jgi:phosphoribosylformylglycinamidine cyclo-ligase